MTWPLPFVIAHRGAPRLAPENTLAALKKAKSCGAKYVECDVQLTKDHIPIIFHDAILNRTSNGSGKVARTNVDVIQTLDAGSWFSEKYRGEKIPTLENWLLCAKTLEIGVNIEIKTTADAQAKLLAVAVVTAFNRIWNSQLPQPLISSFYFFALKCVASLSSNYLLGWNTEKPISSKKIPSFISSLHIREDQVDSADVNELHQRGIRILAFTVNDHARAQALKKMGADGIFSDNEALFQCDYR